MTEALECWDCNSSLDWEGDVPDLDDVVCHDCSEDRLRATIARLTAERDALRERCKRLARAARAATFVVHRDQVPFAMAFADLLPGDLEGEGVK